MVNIDIVFDCLDEAALIYYDAVKLDYLLALSEIANNLTNDIYTYNLSEEVLDKLNSVYNKIKGISLSTEEIRQALQLYVIKGFKHVNYKLDLMTPDFINYLFVLIVKELFSGSDLNIIDPNLGTGNLLATIYNNYLGKINLTAVEDDGYLVEFARAFFLLQDIDISIYYQDALGVISGKYNLFISDLDSYYVDEEIDGFNYFPYLVLRKYMDNLEDDGYFIFLVDNDFFKVDYSNLLRTLDNEVSILGVITLPSNLFSNSDKEKSIVIAKKTKIKINELNVVEFNALNSAGIKDATSKIMTMINIIKELE